MSWYNGPSVAVAMNTVIVKDAELVGSLASPNSFGPVLRYMAEGKLKVKPLITHVKPLSELADVVQMIREEKGDADQGFAEAVKQLILLVKSRLEIIKKDIHFGNKERT